MIPLQNTCGDPPRFGNNSNSVKNGQGAAFYVGWQINGVPVNQQLKRPGFRFAASANDSHPRD